MYPAPASPPTPWGLHIVRAVNHMCAGQSCTAEWMSVPCREPRGQSKGVWDVNLSLEHKLSITHNATRKTDVIESLFAKDRSEVIWLNSSPYGGRRGETEREKKMTVHFCGGLYVTWYCGTYNLQLFSIITLCSVAWGGSIGGYKQTLAVSCFPLRGLEVSFALYSSLIDFTLFLVLLLYARSTFFFKPKLKIWFTV